MSLAPFYNPLRLAEEVALLDVLSGGRVNWGRGAALSAASSKPSAFAGEESAARFHETVDIVLKAWSTDKLSYQGKFFSYDGVEVLPKPLQQPHPPGVDGGQLTHCHRVGGGQGLFHSAWTRTPRAGT